jgi:hypothetical protein
MDGEEGLTIDVTGLEQVTAFLERASLQAKTEMVFNALTAGTKPIMAELAVRTPIGTDPRRDIPRFTKGYRRKLLESLTTAMQLDNQGRGGRAQVGYGGRGHTAMWIELGHRMVGHRPEMKYLGWFAPRPFMRPAAEAAAEAAIEAVAVSISVDVLTLK